MLTAKICLMWVYIGNRCNFDLIWWIDSSRESIARITILFAIKFTECHLLDTILPARQWTKKSHWIMARWLNSGLCLRATKKILRAPRRIGSADFAESTPDDGHRLSLWRVLQVFVGLKFLELLGTSNHTSWSLERLLIGFDDLPGRSEKPPKSSV